MKPRLQEIDAIVADEIHQPILASDASRPDIPTHLLEMLGLAYSRERVSHDGLDQIENTKRRFSVCINPPAHIFQTFGLDDGVSICARPVLPMT
jgi:hypothetical protein